MNNERTRTFKRLILSHLGTSAKLTQVERLAIKFGGYKALFEALKKAGHKINQVSVYRWNHPKSKGGGDGVVPKNAMTWIIKAARMEGMILTAEDLDPRPVSVAERHFSTKEKPPTIEDEDIFA